jgi:hypothetical protein
VGFVEELLGLGQLAFCETQVFRGWEANLTVKASVIGQNVLRLGDQDLDLLVASADFRFRPNSFGVNNVMTWPYILYEKIKKTTFFYFF